MRPEGLPKIPDTVSPWKVENMEDVRVGAGDPPAGDLLGHGREES